MATRIRNTARGILLTPQHEVLLMRMRFPWEAYDKWILPGGGIEGGESAEEAVVREIFEETGAKGFEIAGEAWWREFEVSAMQTLMKQRYFLIEIERFDPIASELLGDERGWLQEYRWWGISELSNCAVDVEPANIASALQMLLDRGISASPINVDEL